MSDLVLIERDGPIATVVLNRPDQRNAISLSMWGELATLARSLDVDPEIRVVVLRGAGTKAFSAGADISEFEQNRNNSALAREYANVFEGALDAVAEIGKPTISLIQGACVGGGLELASATDLRIAGEDATFGVPIARLGILVGYKEMRRLVNLVGPGAAIDLLLTARLIDAAEALRVGLLSQVWPSPVVAERTYALARQISELAPLSARRHKQILQFVIEHPRLENLSEEQQALPLSCFDTADFQEGRTAFLAKRKPNFRGQ